MKREPRLFRPDRLFSPAAAAAAGFLLPAAGSLWHILARKSPPSWDDGWYLTVSLRLWDAFTGLDWMDFAALYAGGLAAKPPLIALLPFPFYALFGRGMPQALLANLACLAAASVFAYRIGRRLHSPQAGALAVCFLNTTPIVYGVSRLFFVECALVAVTTAAMDFLLAGTRGFPLGLTFGLGALAKLSFPLYIAAPAALLAGRGRKPRDWLVIAALAGALAATWYAVNLGFALRFGASAGFGDTARAYGPGSGALGIVSYAGVLIRQCWSLPHFLTALLCAGAALGMKPRPRLGPHARDTFAVLAWILVPLAVLAMSPSRTYRWTAPAIAGASVGLGVLAAIAKAKLPRLPWSATALLFAAPLAVYWEQTTGRRLPPDPRGSLPAAFAHNGPPLQEGLYGQDELLQALAQDAAASPGAIAVIGIQERFFNARTAAFWAALRRRPLRFAPLDHNMPPERLFLALRSEPRYILLVKDWPEELPRHFNRHNEGARLWLERGNLPFSVWKESRLANGALATVYRRN